MLIVHSGGEQCGLTRAFATRPHLRKQTGSAQVRRCSNASYSFDLVCWFFLFRFARRTRTPSVGVFGGPLASSLSRPLSGGRDSPNNAVKLTHV